MIIKGNSVGHPLSDPRKGLNMTGSINMNLKRLFGVKTPVEADDATNKAYVDAHINNKSNPHGVTAEQVSARPNTWTPSASDVGATPASHATDKNNPHGVTAAQVGARPDTWMPTAAQVGAATLDYVKEVGNLENCLVNPDFTNPVNPEGFTSTNMDDVQIIPRWFSNSSSNEATISLGPSGLTVAKNDGIYGGIYQNFEHYADMHGKTYTAAVCINGIWEYETFTMGLNAGGSVFPISGLELFSVEWEHFLLRNYRSEPVTIQTARVFEGAYTEKNTPKYKPRGYMVEALNCGALTVHKAFEIPASGWSGSAPYTQTVSVEGINENDMPHISPVYSDDLATALAQKEAWEKVSRGKAGTNTITFICYGDKPTTSIPIQIEVNR